jgi:hypothetical protein
LVAEGGKSACANKLCTPWQPPSLFIIFTYTLFAQHTLVVASRKLMDAHGVKGYNYYMMKQIRKFSQVTLIVNCKELARSG